MINKTLFLFFTLAKIAVETLFKMHLKARLALSESYNNNLYFTVKDKDKASYVRPGYNFFHVVFSLQLTPVTM